MVLCTVVHVLQHIRMKVVRGVVVMLVLVLVLVVGRQVMMVAMVV